MNMKWAGDNWTLLLPGAGAGVAGLFLDLEQGVQSAGQGAVLPAATVCCQGLQCGGAGVVIIL